MRASSLPPAALGRLDANLSAWGNALLLVGLAAGFLCIGGWNLDLQQVVNPDEPRYACAARDMVTGASNWVVPQFNGAPRLKKPILLYWAMGVLGMAALMADAEMTLGFRWASLLGGLIAVLAAYGIGRGLFDNRVGLLSGLILTATPYFHMKAREILIDPILTGILAASWLFFILAFKQVYQERTPPLRLLVPLYLLLGLAGLAKGLPLVLVFGLIPMTLSVLVGQTWFAQKGKAPQFWTAARKSFARMGFVWGIPLTILVSSIWFFLLDRHGLLEETLQTLSSETLGKVSGDGGHTSSFRKVPILYYLGSITSGFLPWSLLFFPALWYAWIKRKQCTYREALLLIAVLVPMGILGLFPSKRSLYLLPVFPLVSIGLAHIWCGSFVAEGMSKRFRFLWMGILLFILLVGAAIAAGAAFPHASGLNAYLDLSEAEVAVAKLLAFVLVALVGISIAAFRNGLRFRVSLLALGGVCFGLWAYEAAIRPAEERETRREALYSQVGALLGPGRELLWLGGSSNEAVWYLNSRIRDIGAAELAEELASGRNVAVMIRARELSRASGVMGTTRELARWKIGDDEYLLLEPRDAPAMQTRAGE